MEEIEKGKRILITHTIDEEFLPRGERGTIEDVSYDSYRLTISVRLDNGKRKIIDNVGFRFEVY